MQRKFKRQIGSPFVYLGDEIYIMAGMDLPVAAIREQVASAVNLVVQQARFPSGPFLLAHLLNCPVYLVFALFTEPNRYDVHCELFADAIRLPRATREESVRAYAQKYASRLEHYVREAPQNWFNFYDFWSD